MRFLKPFLLHTLWRLAAFSWHKKETYFWTSKEISPQNSAIGNVLEKIKTDIQFTDNQTHRDSHQKETKSV